MNHDRSNVNNPTLFQRTKSIEKNIEKRKYWQNHLRKAVYSGKTLKILRNITEKISRKNIDKNFLIDPLNKNNEIYHESLTLIFIFLQKIWGVRYKELNLT